MAHLPQLRTKATGIFSINVRTDEVKVLGQTDEGRGFWHCNGSSDGKWAVGDNFIGNLWLLNVVTGQRTLLTTDHKMKPDHTHPTFSPDNKRILFQSGLLSNGKSLDLMIITIPGYLQ
jgi:oligogalacturonide lyase